MYSFRTLFVLRGQGELDIIMIIIWMNSKWNLDTCNWDQQTFIPLTTDSFHVLSPSPKMINSPPPSSTCIQKFQNSLSDSIFTLVLFTKRYNYFYALRASQTVSLIIFNQIQLSLEVQQGSKLQPIRSHALFMKFFYEMRLELPPLQSQFCDFSTRLVKKYLNCFVSQLPFKNA